MTSWENMGWDDDDEQVIRPAVATEGNSDVDALRQEVAELKNLLSDRLDSAEDSAFRENRAAVQAQAERATKATIAANDPATLEELKGIDTEVDLIRWMTERGYEGGSL